MSSANTLVRIRQLTMRGIALVGLTLMSPLLLAQDSTVPADQQAVIEIVRLQYRDPDVIRAALTPYLDVRGAISQIDHNLIIGTTRANLDELERIIDELDIPLKQLLIRVDFDYAASDVQRADDGNLLNTITPQRLEYPVQSMQVTEGEYIYFNRYQNTAQISSAFGPYALQLQQDRQRSEQSVTIKAEIKADLVELEFAASTIQAGGAGQALSTTTVIGLNQWIPLQQVVDRMQIFSDATTLSTATPERNGDLAVRVEIIP